VRAASSEAIELFMVKAGTVVSNVKWLLYGGEGGAEGEKTEIEEKEGKRR
jgi:hypothetical protein